MLKSELGVKAIGKLNEQTQEEIKVLTPEEKEAEAILARNQCPNIRRGVLPNSIEDSQTASS